MKKTFFGIVFILIVCSSCSLFRGGQKYGCPTNGKNIGAEKIASGDPAAIKAAKKAGKFKGNKF